MPKIILKGERYIHVRVQEVEPKVDYEGKKGYRHGKSRSLTVYGEATVDEVFNIINKALEEASKLQ